MRTLILMLALAAVAVAPVSVAAEIEGVAFPDERQVLDTPLELHRVGLSRYRWIFKVYVAALYLGEGATPAAFEDDAARRLEISYLYGFSAADFAQTTRKGIERNLGAKRALELEPQIERFNALYRDVRPGDRYALTYLPGVGTQLALNGTPLGVVEGADLARALFSIWFGPDPFDAALKRELTREL